MFGLEPACGLCWRTRGPHYNSSSIRPQTRPTGLLMPDADDQPAAGRRLKGLSLISGLTVVSRLAGLARDMLMASLFGTGWVLDTFTVAFRIPGMFRRLFGEGAMTAAFLPRFVDEEQRHGRAAASDLFSAVAWQLIRWLSLTVLLVEAGLVLVWLLTDLSDRSTLLVELTMILLPYAVLICVAALYCAALHGMHHFLVPALLPIALNIMWFTGGLLAIGLLTEDRAQVKLIALSIVAGGVLQLSMAVRRAQQFRIRMQGGAVAEELQQRVSRLFRQMAPVLFGLSITQLNGLVDSLLAWLLAQPPGVLPESLESFRLADGTASALYLGQRLFQFPLGVFGVALGTVLFPRFARHAASGDRQELGRDILHGLQLVLVVGTPASAGLWLVAEPVTDLLFRRGAFDAADALLTVRMIGAYGLGVWVFCGLLIVNRVFYAADDQLTPARQGLLCVGLNLLLNMVLLPVLKETALPVASVLATLCQLALALEVLRRRYLTHGYSRFVPVLWRSLLATLVMVAVCLLIPQEWTGNGSISERLLATALPVSVCAAVYWCCLRITGLSPKRLLEQPF